MQRSDERVLLLCLLFVSAGALLLFLYYVFRLLGSLPDPIPDLTVASHAGISAVSVVAVVRSAPIR